MSSRAYNRDVSRRKALRKRRIDRSKAHGRYYVPYYDNLHQYSKNKVHCSCSMCSAKTRNKGHRRGKSGNYSKSLNYSHADLMRMLAMDADELDALGYIQHKRRYRHGW